MGWQPSLGTVPPQVSNPVPTFLCLFVFFLLSPPLKANEDISSKLGEALATELPQLKLFHCSFFYLLMFVPT